MIPVMFWLTWSMVQDRLPELLRLPMLPVTSGAAAAGLWLKDAMRKASFVLVLLGIVMLVRERARYSKRLRMSKQDLRDEAKDTEGNPQTKARIRRIQRDMRRRNMMREVAKATAVIVNPTHYAVAIQYEQGAMAAPLVVAKGKNYLAARIRQRAIENQVPIIENPPLAQALYKSVDVGQEIPAHLYRAVAEILAYIFKLMGNSRPPKQHDREQPPATAPFPGAAAKSRPTESLASDPQRIGRPGGGARDRRGADCADAELPARSADRDRHHDVRHRADGRDVHHQAGGLQCFSDHAADADAVPAGAERLVFPADSAQWPYRTSARRATSFRRSEISWWAGTTLSARSSFWC